jgi:BolA protein
MVVAERIRAKLEAALQPTRLELLDESAQHAGHAGARPEGETHFRLHIVAEGFAGRSRVERQRLVHRILADELAGPVHALSISAEAPDSAEC